MRSILIATFVSTFLEGQAIAQPFYVGFWVADPETCAYPEFMLEITETTYFGYEDTCELTNPVNIRDMDAILFDAVCHGEGGNKTSRLMIAVEGENQIMLHQHGFTTLLETCE